MAILNAFKADRIVTSSESQKGPGVYSPFDYDYFDNKSANREVRDAEIRIFYQTEDLRIALY